MDMFDRSGVEIKYPPKDLARSPDMSCLRIGAELRLQLKRVAITRPKVLLLHRSEVMGDTELILIVISVPVTFIRRTRGMRFSMS